MKKKLKLLCLLVLRYWMPFILVAALNILLHFITTPKPGMFWLTVAFRVSLCTGLAAVCWHSQITGERWWRELQEHLSAAERIIDGIRSRRREM